MTKLVDPGHTFIDILKIDIEGSEFDTLTAIIAEYRALGQPLPFGQLQIEIHAWAHSFKDFLKWWESLEEAGLRPFWTEANLVYLNIYRGNAPTLAEVCSIQFQLSAPCSRPLSPSTHSLTFVETMTL